MNMDEKVKNRLAEFMSGTVEIPTKTEIVPDYEAIFEQLLKGPVTYRGFNKELLAATKAIYAAGLRKEKFLKTTQHSVLDDVVAVTMELVDKPAKRKYVKKEVKS